MDSATSRRKPTFGEGEARNLFMFMPSFLGRSWWERPIVLLSPGWNENPEAGAENPAAWPGPASSAAGLALHRFYVDEMRLSRI